MSLAKQRLGRGLGNLITNGSPQLFESSPGAAATSEAPLGKASSRAAVLNTTRKNQPTAKAPAQQPSEGQEGLATLFRTIPLNWIDVNPRQPRREVAPEALHELAESIRSEGLLQPIIVRSKGGRYELIAGERRWRACQQLGLSAIPACILEVPDSASAVLALVENLQRENLNPIEEALGYASLMRDFEWTQEQVAERLGKRKARASIANSLRLLQLDREIQGYVSRGLITPGHAKLLLSVESEAPRLLLARRIVEGGLSVRETEQAVKRLQKRSSSALPSPQAVKNNAVAAALRAVEQRLSAHFHAPVYLQHGPKRGKLVIEYQGEADLQRLLDKLGLPV